MAQPTKYTPEIVSQICDLLCQGIPLEEICRMEGMPDADTVHVWKSENRPRGIPEYVAQAIARAREIGYDAIANGTRAIARGKGESTGDVARDKLIIETELKLLAKWMPKKYGDKQIVDVNIDMSISDRLERASKMIEGRVAALPVIEADVSED